jgi:hypothetical protein
MKAVLAVILACSTPAAGFAASLTGSIIESSATVDLASIGTLDWARWPGYAHLANAISNVTTTGASKTYPNDPRLIGDRSGIKVTGVGASFEFTVAATTVERTLTYYIGGWNSTGLITVTLPGAPSYTTTFTSGTTFSRVVTVKFRADAAASLKVTYTQVAGAGRINMQAAALSTAGGAATLTWQPPATNVDGSPLTDLAAFKVYWGTTPGAYPYFVQVTNVAAPTHTVSGLGPGTWYFVVTALNASGGESAYSNVWLKTIP